jgi:GxxExxY protein
MHVDEINAIASQILGVSFRIHSALGPGLLESVYQAILLRDLERLNFRVEENVRVPIVFEELTFAHAFRADLIVERAVLVELKSVDDLAPVHAKQVLTYLRLTKIRLGLLLNFGAPHMKDGIRRVVNGL